MKYIVQKKSFFSDCNYQWSENEDDLSQADTRGKAMLLPGEDGACAAYVVWV